jgi:hypothetical protein
MKKRMDSIKVESGGKSIMRFFNIMAAMVFCIVLAGAAHAQQKKKDSPLTMPQPQTSDKVPGPTIMPSEVPSLGPPTTAPMQTPQSAGDLIKEPVKGHKYYDEYLLAPGGWSNTPAMASQPDLAVMDLFVDNNCEIKFILKNKGGGFSNDSNSMQIDFCTNNNTCFTYSVGLNSLKPAGGQETHQVPSTTKYYISPPSVQPITLKIYPEYYNIPDANPSNNSLTRNLQCAQ